MPTLPTADVVVLIVYVLGVVAFGCWFVRRSRTPAGFMTAGGTLPGWAVGLSIFGTYLSSNTFIGVPGRAFGANWSFFVFSLSLPIAAVIGAKVFVPFYRRSGEISAYHHLEKRFGPWARTYAAGCYLLAMIGRMATILYGVSLGVSVLTGFDLRAVIAVTGLLITLYTLLGGIAAVIWTDVVQSIVLMAGAVAIAGLLVLTMPGGPSQVISIAADAGKFSLGSFDFDFATETFWAVLLYGVFSNLDNFGIKQSFVQRYHTARSDAEARRALYGGALLYLPVSLLFFFIGSSLFAYYHAPGNEALLADVRTEAAAPGQKPETLEPRQYGDKVLPHFIRHKLPPGLAGLLIAAIVAAAMSSIDTSLNSSATVILSDLYKRYVRPDADARRSLRVLRGSTVVWGALATGCALAMIGVESVLAVWWQISGIFSGALLGLFLLGLIARRARGAEAALGVAIGLVAIVYLTFSPHATFLPAWLRSPIHTHLTVVLGTLTIFLTGLLASRLRRRRKPSDPGHPA